MENEYAINQMIELVEEDKATFFWTVREKTWNPETNEIIYYATRPGHHGWFTHEYLKAHSAIGTTESA
ncbi:hypothetical protein [Paenibacillus harenae]|uniref:hypothetical protein n=1 Tax=Paenibacillus harenae TaxID=306543 RepID=UPI0003F74C84|nr:hypothetical protein [Paenibacillus harenae]